MSNVDDDTSVKSQELKKIENGETADLHSEEHDSSEEPAIEHNGLEKVPTQVSEQPWTPPNGGYGWVCVVTVWFINAHTWGLNSVRQILN
jgi:hypothetical protein